MKNININCNLKTNKHNLIGQHVGGVDSGLIGGICTYNVVVSIELIWPFFMPFSYNGVYQVDLMLSICDNIVSKKTVQWRMKVAFIWAGQQFYSLSLRKNKSAK